MTKEEKESLVIRLITGELPADQAAKIRDQMSQDEDLQRLYLRLQALYELTALEEQSGNHLRGATKRYDNILLASKLRAGRPSTPEPAPTPTVERTLWRAFLEDTEAQEIGQIRNGLTLVGAVRPCRIRIEDKQVSGVHARFLFSESTGGLWIEDLDSTNGTHLLKDSQKILLTPPKQIEGRDYWLPTPRPLEDGDHLLFGSTQLKVRIETFTQPTDHISSFS